MALDVYALDSCEASGSWGGPMVLDVDALEFGDLRSGEQGEDEDSDYDDEEEYPFHGVAPLEFVEGCNPEEAIRAQQSYIDGGYHDEADDVRAV